MRLPVAQRSGVILMDVLGCSLAEVCEVMDYSLPAVKAALHRGRTQLRELADEGDDRPRPTLSAADRARLDAYVTHFNARDFDAIRAMIADDVRLELVGKTRLNGKAEVSRYSSITKKRDGTRCRAPVEGASRDPGVRSGCAGCAAELFHAGELAGRQGRRYPGFPPRCLCDRGCGLFHLTSPLVPPVDPLRQSPKPDRHYNSCQPLPRRTMVQAAARMSQRF
jgi:hypothetical protein